MTTDIPHGARFTLPGTPIPFRLTGTALAGVFRSLDASGHQVALDAPEWPISGLLQGGTFTLAALPATTTSVHLLCPAGQASLELDLPDGQQRFTADLSGASLLAEFYRKDGDWKFAARAEPQGTPEDLTFLLNQARSLHRLLHPGGPGTAPAEGLSLHKQNAQRTLLSLAKQQAPGLVPVIEQARLSLEKAGLDHLTFEVRLVLDKSGSMSGLYHSGQVQRLIERALAVAARLDDDGQVPVTLFNTQVEDKGTVDLSSIGTFVRRMAYQPDGGTDYAPAIREVVQQARDAHWPTLVLFITDGENGDPREAEAAMKDASSEAVFFKFLALGDGPFRFLERLDTMPGRVVDNANFAQIGDLASTSDAELFRLIGQEITDWMRAAGQAGLLDAERRPARRPQSPGGAPPSPTPPGPAPQDTRPWWKKIIG